jgi:hypothetical protein
MKLRRLGNGWLGCVVVALLAAPSLASLGRSPSSSELSSDKVRFSIRYKNEVSSYRVNGVFVLPGESLSIEVVDSGAEDHEMEASGGSLTRRSSNAWVWSAPREAGLYRLVVRQVRGGTITLNAFVMVPSDRIRSERMNGYQIGAYPSAPREQLAIYEPPRGFIEVQPGNLDTWVSPHFQLWQFLCKQEGGFPKYVVLQEKLLLKLELILEEINKKGYRSDSLEVMSGYRTPFYNKAIGNVPYSRHVWGGAADIFIDEAPRDGQMDDLNRDGVIDERDASVLHDVIDALHERPYFAPFLGGLARYRATSAHGPFVHVDERGFRARWGT